MVCIVMLKNAPDNPAPGVDPAPQFATPAEIELAERLRSQLERRYLGHSATQAPEPMLPISAPAH